MNVFCPNCGTPNTEESEKCVACGKLLKQPNAAKRFKGTMVMHSAKPEQPSPQPGSDKPAPPPVTFQKSSNLASKGRPSTGSSTSPMAYQKTMLGPDNMLGADKEQPSSKDPAPPSSSSSRHPSMPPPGRRSVPPGSGISSAFSSAPPRPLTSSTPSAPRQGTVAGVGGLKKSDETQGYVETDKIRKSSTPPPMPPAPSSIPPSPPVPAMTPATAAASAPAPGLPSATAGKTSSDTFGDAFPSIVPGKKKDLKLWISIGIGCFIFAMAACFAGGFVAYKLANNWSDSTVPDTTSEQAPAQTQQAPPGQSPSE